MTNRRTINIRLPEKEAALLARYAAETDQTKTAVLRAFIRSLERKKPSQ